MYKIYIENKTVYLTDKQEYLNNLADGLIVRYDSKSSLKILIEKFELLTKERLLYIYADDLNELFFEFKSLYVFIEAAGGLVYNNNKQFLTIFRKGKWDLPKGKVEEGEQYSEAAIREVSEECGIQPLRVLTKLKSTYHTYWINDQRVLKKTYWYEMFYDGQEKLVPQTEEDIVEAKWIYPSDVKIVLENTYLSIASVLKEGVVF